MSDEEQFREETARLRELAEKMDQEKPPARLRTYNTRIRKWDSANWILIIPAIVIPIIIYLIVFFAWLF